MLNVDTHVLIDAMTGSLPAREESLLRSETWSISAIVLWELAKLAQLGRIDLDLDDPDVERFLAQIHTWPISLEVVRAMVRLDFRSDPADELIAATSLVHHVPLLTRDRRILKSKIVPLARR
jgi:PIN domain nuclease of toxin-antitoxin system